jgi:ABC-type sugar transport system ATPase subunit
MTHESAAERDVAMVFQSYALYPHMTVAQNIGFPLKMVGQSAGAIAGAVHDAAAKVGIAHLLDRKPGQLSGGQQQRVALSRAIVRQPRLFLLDEPLSNLDAKLRVETRVELKKLQRALGVTGVYVTHDQEEAMTLADRVAVFMEGRIVQVASPKEIFGRPAHASVAGFIGTPPMNLLPVTWLGNSVSLDGAGRVAVGVSTPSEKAATLGVRPADLRFAPQGLAALVELVEELGDSHIVIASLGAHRVKIRTDPTSTVREGDRVFLDFAPGAAHLFDRASGTRLN